MPNPLPNCRQNPRHHQIKEEILQHNRRRLQIIAIHIDRTDTTNHPAPGHEKHPIPLPPPPNSMEPLLLRQEQPPMFPQIQNRERDREGKERGEDDAERAARGYAVVGEVARGRVEEGAVGQ